MSALIFVFYYKVIALDVCGGYCFLLQSTLCYILFVHLCSSTKRRCLEQPTDTDEMDSSDSTIILDRSTEGSGSPGSDSKESELEGEFQLYIYVFILVRYLYFR